jgi:hypothetical protein
MAFDRFDDLPVLPVLTLHGHRNDSVDRRHQEQNREKPPEDEAENTISSTLKTAENG